MIKNNVAVVGAGLPQGCPLWNDLPRRAGRRAPQQPPPGTPGQTPARARGSGRPC